MYPDSDGQPMGDNTEQFDWIVLLQRNLDWIRPDDFVAGDLLWYPVEGQPKIRVAPDVLVAPGRPKGRRGSYIQHREEGVPPKVVFEVLSPEDTAAEMTRKTFFYHTYGVDEFILIDPDAAPDAEAGTAFVRDDQGHFEAVDSLDGWTSPYLKIRFERQDGRLVVFRPDGTPFKSLADAEAEAAEAGRKAAEAEDKAAKAEDKAAAERARAQRLAEKLRALGIDPEAD